MFAAHPDRVLAEVTRVTRPGGRFAVSSWTRSGFMGELFGIEAALVPGSLETPDPLRWGEAGVVEDWFDDREWRVTAAPQTAILRYPHTPSGTAELFRAAHGPTVWAFESLDEDRRALLAADLAAHFARHRRTSAAGTEVEAEYLEVVAVRR